MSDSVRPAGYGRACNSCSRAKCKCILTTSGGACERCLRLNKVCQPAVGVRKTPGRKAVSKTAQLEGKLDDLVALLRSTGRNAVSVDGASLGDVAPPGGSQYEASDARVSSEGRQGAVSDCGATAYGSPVSMASAAVATGGVSVREAEECLEVFRSQKLKYFHFVHIPPSTTTAQLREERPFLWLSILAATVKSAAKQHALGIRLRDVIADRLVARHERTMDLLLGLLGFLGWMSYHLGPHPFVTMYAHIAAALVQDLGIDRPPPKPNELHPIACVSGHGIIVKPPPSRFRTMEERRAVLACYLVTMSMSTFLRRTPPLRWTSHMAECLKIVDEQMEAPLDRILVYQVRLQRISDEAPCTLMITNSELSEQTRLLRSFQTRALLSRVEELRQTLPPDLPEDLATICRLHSVAAEAAVNAVALCSCDDGRDNNGPDMQRITMLTSCLQLTKTWFDELLAQPPSTFFYFAFPLFTHLAYFTVVLYRLSTLEDRFWDRRGVRRTLDAFPLLDALAAKFAAVPAAAGIVADDGHPTFPDVFTRMSRSIRPIKAAWEPVFAQVLSGGNAVNGDSDSGSGSSGGGGAAAGSDNTNSGGDGGDGDILAPPAAAATDPDDVAFWEGLGFDFAEGLNGWVSDVFGPGWDVMS